MVKRARTPAQTSQQRKPATRPAPIFLPVCDGRFLLMFFACRALWGKDVASEFGTLRRLFGWLATVRRESPFFLTSRYGSLRDVDVSRSPSSSWQSGIDKQVAHLAPHCFGSVVIIVDRGEFCADFNRAMASGLRVASLYPARASCGFALV